VVLHGRRLSAYAKSVFKILRSVTNTWGDFFMTGGEIVMTGSDSSYYTFAGGDFSRVRNRRGGDICV